MNLGSTISTQSGLCPSFLLHFIQFLTQMVMKSLYTIPYVEVSVKIPSCYVSLLKRAGPKCPTLYGFRFFYLKHMKDEICFF